MILPNQEKKGKPHSEAAVTCHKSKSNHKHLRNVNGRIADAAGPEYQPSGGLLEIAREYTNRGWSVIPLPFTSKKPNLPNWQKLRLTKSELPAYFGGESQNIGVLLGGPSHWLVDIDLDHPRAVELADEYLPPTQLTFGRLGKPSSHRLYRVTSPVESIRHKSRSAGMIVELRSSGTQTVFPPSVHETGESIEWAIEFAEPAEIDPRELADAVERLADAVKNELGESTTSHPSSQLRSPTSQMQRVSGSDKFTAPDPRKNCLAAMLGMDLIDHNDGSCRLYAAACRIVEHDLDDDAGVELIQEYARLRPFKTAWDEQDILARIRDAEKKSTRGSALVGPPSKQKIILGTDEYRVTDDAIAALSADDELFRRGTLLVRVLRERTDDDGVVRHDGAPTIGVVPTANLRERLTHFASFVKYKKTKGNECEETAAHPPQWLVRAVEARGDWPGIRRLDAISAVPVLRADGSIQQTPGYDPTTRVLFEPQESFPAIPKMLTLEDAQSAADSLLEVVAEFPFEMPEHRSAWLAGLLTPLAMTAFEGPAPLNLIDANVPGAGKGLLVQTIASTVLGHEMPASGYAHDNAEMRKLITSIALAGDRLMLLDNIEGCLGNDALDRALTASRWKDRLLGGNEVADLPLRVAWYATGNNVTVAADTARRIIHIRLDVLEERPEERRGFRHPELIRWVQDQRPRLVMQALTILAAYCQAGRPTHDLTPFGSFEGWSALVREALVWIGQPDPCLTRARLAEFADATCDELRQLKAAWWEYDPENYGLVVAEVLNRLYPLEREYMPMDGRSMAMREALEYLTSCPPGKAPSARQVGKKLSHFRKRVLDGQYFDIDRKGRGGAVWRIWDAAPPE